MTSRPESAPDLPAGHPPPCSALPPMPAGARDALRRGVAAAVAACGRLRVFAYASLIWRTPYPLLDATPATVAAHRVAPCVWTVQARGSPGAPGLGLGLLRAPGTAAGVVQTVPPAAHEQALAALWEREMLTGVYRPSWITARTRHGDVEALAFVVEPRHRQFAGRLPLERQAALIAAASGALGTNLDYLAETVAGLAGAGLAQVLDTVAGLAGAGLHNDELDAVLARARRLAGTAS